MKPGVLSLWLHGDHLGEVEQLRNGSFELAPAYDIAPVFHIDARFSDFGMRVGGQRNLRHITLDGLVCETTSWGMYGRRAREVVIGMTTAVRKALDAAPMNPLVEPVAAAIARRTDAFVRAG